MTPELYIGVMSGTSMDGIDVVLANFKNNQPHTLGHHTRNLPSSLKQELLSLCSPGDNEIDRSCTASIRFAKECSLAILELLEQHSLKTEDIVAIGSHGQTIRHSPDSIPSYTLQIGSPSHIAHETGITTIGDFRMADMAAGGQGAPLAPAFHEALFSSEDKDRLIINLGGIANITVLSPTQPTYGFDTGPSNTLMDQWTYARQGKDFDRNGDWARSGVVITSLLQQFLDDPFIRKTSPKSTGREYFNLDWLEQHLKHATHQKDNDIQRTLLEFTASSVSLAVKQCGSPDSEIFLCGGGVHNSFLIERLKNLLPEHAIQSTSILGIDPQQVEATAFAWLAYQTLNHLPGNLPCVTGAKTKKVLGGIYPAA